MPKLRGGAPLLYLGTRNLLRSSYIDWTTRASSDLFADDDGEVDMVFSIVPRLSFVNTRDHWAWVGTDVSWSILLHSDFDRESGTVLFHDLPLQTGYAYAFVQNDDGLVLQAGPRASVAFPTSEESQAVGVYARTSLALRADAAIPLARGDWLNGLFVSASGGWGHLFSEATTPVNASLNRAPGGSDQISTRFFVRDQLSLSLAYWLNVWGDLSLGNSWGVAAQYRDSPSRPSGCSVVVANETCTAAPAVAGDPGASHVTSFGLSLGYAIARLVWVEWGYFNSANAIGEDGQRRSIFYSPAAKLYLSATWMLDATWERVRGPRPP